MNKYPYLDIFHPSYFLSSPSLFSMKNKENHAPSHPRVVVRPSLTPPWRFVSVQTAKECKSSWQRSGRGAERKGGGEESNVRINLYSLQLHPVFCADFRGSGWETLRYLRSRNNVNLSVHRVACMFERVSVNVQYERQQERERKGDTHRWIL